MILVFTRSMGKVKAVARGARKPKSKTGPALELFTESVFSLHKKSTGDLYVLGQCKITDDYHELKNDFHTITLLQLLADVLQESLPDQEPEEEVYSLLKKSLDLLRSNRTIREQVLTAFLLKFLGLSGFPLELDHCVECGEALERKVNFLVPHRGGALCGDCCPSGQSSWKVSPSGLGILRKLKDLPLEKIHILKPSPDQTKELLLTVLGYLERTIEKRLQSLEYYLKVV